MKRLKRTLVLDKTSIRTLTSHHLARAGGGIFDQEQQQTTLTGIGVSGGPPPETATCSWGCTKTCQYPSCA